ncbi:MAG: hypothetical protein EOO90_11780 [Pedobacter sp.]|nr:MAG: hypothetical protein EOO90_11780 [Pedobacter sp.]
MKTTLNFFFTLLLCSSCFAQHTLKEGEYQYDGKTFKVKKTIYLDRTLITIRALGQFEDKPTPGLKDPNGLPMGKKQVHFDIEAVKGIVNNTLRGKFGELQRNKDGMTLSFHFWQRDGSIESISYRLNGSSLITVKEIAAIDKQIKENIRATFSGKEHQNYTLIQYGDVKVEF